MRWTPKEGDESVRWPVISNLGEQSVEIKIKMRTPSGMSVDAPDRFGICSARTLQVKHRILLVLAVTACVAGCKSTSPSQYISPRVEGRVLDGQSHEPIQGVRVHRVVQGGNQQVADTPHGGEQMEEAPVMVTTSADGSFVVDSERDIALFRHVSWYSVSIAFEHPAYTSYTATYMSSNAVTTASGEPVVHAGDVLMKPLTK
jgi:hypothetical protein